MNAPRCLLLLLCPVLFCLANKTYATPILLTPYNSEPALASFSVPASAWPGKLIYTYDTAVVKGPGIPWPWNNGIVLRDFTMDQSSFKSYNVVRERADFVFGPQWIDGERVLMKVGDPNSSFGGYDLALWNTKSSSVETLQKRLSWKQVWPSPSGRFIAFIKGGGDVPFGASSPAFFCTLDLQTREERMWSALPPSVGNFWTPDDKILFFNVKNETVLKDGKQTQIQVTSLLEGDVKTGEERKVLDDTFNPSVSPDGQWVTYFKFVKDSSTKELDLLIPDPTLPQPHIKPTLVVASRDGLNPQNLRSLSPDDTTIVWRPDSSGFLLCQRRVVGNNQRRRAVEIVVEEGRVGADKLQRIGTFRYFVPAGTETSQDDLLWRPLRISKDNRFLLFELRQFGEDKPQGLSLQAFEIATAKTTVWAHIGSVRGLDWRE